VKVRSPALGRLLRAPLPTAHRCSWLPHSALDRQEIRRIVSFKDCLRMALRPRNDGTGRWPTGRFRRSTAMCWWRTERDETGKFPSSRTNPRTAVNHGLSNCASFDEGRKSESADVVRDGKSGLWDPRNVPTTASILEFRPMNAMDTVQWTLWAGSARQRCGGRARNPMPDVIC
jgi:hypothetical protein